MLVTAEAEISIWSRGENAQESCCWLVKAKAEKSNRLTDVIAMSEHSRIERQRNQGRDTLSYHPAGW
jgi:hypothetical protein